MSASSDAESLVYEFDLDEPLEQVWHALTSPELLARWLLPLDGEPGANIELELAACCPPTYVAYHWRGEHEPQTLVTFEVHRCADGRATRLRLTHQVAEAGAQGPVALLQAA